MTRHNLRRSEPKLTMAHVLKIFIAKARVLDPRTLAAFECCEELASDASWRREKMARKYAEIAHGRWPTELVGPPRLQTTWDVDDLWLDRFDKRRLPRDPVTLQFFREPALVLALLKHTRDPCPARARQRECDAARTEHRKCDLSWEQATRDYVKHGYGSISLALEAYRLWEPYYALPFEVRGFVKPGLPCRRDAEFIPPDAVRMDKIVAARIERDDFIKSLGDEPEIVLKNVRHRYPVERMDLVRIAYRARVERERALRAAFKARNIRIHETSDLALMHVMTGERTIEDVIEIAEEMSWLVSKTGYHKEWSRLSGCRSRKLWEIPFHETAEVERLDRIQMSEGAKDAALRAIIYRLDGASRPDMPKRVAERFDRLLRTDPPFEACSPWDV